MARYQILAQMLVVPKPMAIAEADTPADAVNKARQAEKRGSQNLQIGDVEAAMYYSVEQFAAMHGVR